MIPISAAIEVRISLKLSLAAASRPGDTIFLAMLRMIKNMLVLLNALTRRAIVGIPNEISAPPEMNREMEERMASTPASVMDMVMIKPMRGSNRSCPCGWL